MNSEKIEDSFQLKRGEAENVLNIPAFKNTFTKLKFKNKIMCFILFFFRDFVEKKAQQIMDGIKGYLNEDNINSFYTIYDKEIENAKIHENINTINNSQANDANQDNENMIFIQKTNESFPNQEKETEIPAVKNLVQELSSSNGHETKSLINNEDNLAQIKKEPEDLRKANETSNKKIDKLNEKIEPLKNKVAEFETNYKILDKKLSLVILEKIIEEYNLNVKEN